MLSVSDSSRHLKVSGSSRRTIIKNVALSLGEILVGIGLTVVSAKVSLLILNSIWTSQISQNANNGLATSILLLLSFIFLCACIIVAASEWMWIFKWHRRIFFRADAYQGAFLGISTSMLLLMLTEWVYNSLLPGTPLRTVLLPVAALIKLTASVIPPAIFILLFAPIGAFLGCKYSARRP